MSEKKAVSSYLLLLGGILLILPNLPGLNETLSLLKYEIFLFKGGVTFLGSFGSFPNIINGWTSLSLPGEILWWLFIIIGAASMIVGLLRKSEFLLKITGIIGGAVGNLVLLLIYLGKTTDVSHFGFNNISGPISIGMGFWLLLGGSLVILIAGLMLIKED